MNNHELVNKDTLGATELLLSLHKPTIQELVKYEWIDAKTDTMKVVLYFNSQEHFSDWLSEIKNIARREGHIEGLAAYKQKVRNFALEILND